MIGQFDVETGEPNGILRIQDEEDLCELFQNGRHYFGLCRNIKPNGHVKILFLGPLQRKFAIAETDGTGKLVLTKGGQDEADLMKKLFKQ